jgi:biopolymer transport protein ExbD
VPLSEGSPTQEERPLSLAVSAPRGRYAAPQLAMTPLIDCVFLLLIFFLFSQFQTLEGELVAQLPARGGLVPGAQVLPEEAPPVVRVYIAREEDGSARYVLDGVALAAPDRLHPALLALRDRRPALEAVLDGDDALPFDPFLFAFNACLRAGITRVNLTRPKVPEPEDL